MTSFRGGKHVMLITSRIRSVSSQTVPVPPVLVSLLDGGGATVYEWTRHAQGCRNGAGRHSGIFDRGQRPATRAP